MKNFLMVLFMSCAFSFSIKAKCVGSVKQITGTSPAEAKVDLQITYEDTTIKKLQGELDNAFFSVTVNRENKMAFYLISSGPDYLNGVTSRSSWPNARVTMVQPQRTLIIECGR